MTKDRIIYNEDGSFGVDEDSLNKFDLIFKYNQANNKTVFDNDKDGNIDQLMDILTPRMQKQLVDELHNNEANDQPNWFKDGNLSKYYEGSNDY